MAKAARREHTGGSRDGEKSEAQPPRRTIDIDGLAEELARVVRLGLPATERSAGQVLPNLRSVAARAVHPDDVISRLMALNKLLPRIIDELTDEDYRDAARSLFGAATGTRRTGLMARRRQAADRMAVHVDHFRKNIEPEMLRAVAELLYEDLLRYKSRVKRSVPSLEPTGDTPKLTQDDLTAEEELLSRIWSKVYELRAETIAHLRLSGHSGYEAQAEDHRQAAMRVQDQLRALIQEYVKTYGPLIRHGEAEYAAEALERLTGWRL